MTVLLPIEPGLSAIALFMVARVPKREKTDAEKEDKDDHHRLPKRLRQCSQQRAIIERDMQYAGDDQKPTEPLMGRLDQADVYLEKEEDARQCRESKGAQGKWGDPFS